jgi:hypothetical protein
VNQSAKAGLVETRWGYIQRVSAKFFYVYAEMELDPSWGKLWQTPTFLAQNCQHKPNNKSRVQELNLPSANYEFAASTARPTLVGRF